MLKYFSALITALLSLPGLAERNCLPAEQPLPSSWFQNFPAYRVIGPLYSVGGVDLSVYLITTSEGHILINSGMEDSAEQIRTNVESLGFKWKDIKILLVQQSHLDHAAALAEIKIQTGAELWATEKDAPILEDGGRNDPHFGECLDLRFPPIEVDRELGNGEAIELGGMVLTTHLHPGHTEGSSSYSFQHFENGQNYEVLVANLGSINDGKRLVVNPTYPNVANDFAQTYHDQLNMKIDVWVSAHASQFDRNAKLRLDDEYSPDRFVDPEGFKEAVRQLRYVYLQQIEKEQREKANQSGTK